MKITAALCWHDEPAEMLYRCVRSLAGVADELIAFDGAWQHFDGTARSDYPQYTALARACTDVGIPMPVITFNLWESQPVKRAAMMAAARKTGADWILVVDADDWIESHDRGFRATLAGTELDVAEIHASYLIGRRHASRPVRRLFRASTGVTVTGAHNGYRADDGRWLHAPSNIPTEPALDLTAMVTLAHDSSPRPHARQAAMERYYARRAERREETLRYEATV